MLPTRIFLDTNVYIIGVAYPQSAEAKILHWAGFGQDDPGPVEIIASEELFEQIKRVAKRLRNKDWVGEITGHIWQDFNLRYILLDREEQSTLETSGIIPREDAGIYLTARKGQAHCFVSSNRELITTLVQMTGEFECLTADEFVSKFIE